MVRMLNMFDNRAVGKGVAAVFLSLVLGGSAAVFNFPQADSTEVALQYLSMAPGNDETEMNFSWYSPEAETPGVLELTEQSPEANGGTQVVKAELQEASRGFSANEAQVSGLKPSTQYAYRIGDGKGNWSEQNTFTTRDAGSFNFLLMGDPQIGSSWFASHDRKGWARTLNKATANYPETSFILSVGDQVDNSTSEKDYRGYFAPEVLKHIPAATTTGNHDNSEYYGYHFNVPNEAEELGETEKAGGDYYFTYGKTLFMNLNTNSTDMEEHVQFMKETVEATADQDIKWKIVVFHHSIYSVGGHVEDAEITDLRNGLVPAIDALQIDAVLMGHDHSYARTYQMKNFQPLKNQPMKDGAVVSPEGTVYVTANSSSGSKYYDLSDKASPYVAVKEQLEVPTFTNVAITPSSLSFETVRTDTMEQVDEYRIIKEEAN